MHILVNLELKITVNDPLQYFECKNIQDCAERLKKFYCEGTFNAENLIQQASSVTPVFEGVE